MDASNVLKPADLIFVKGTSLIDHAIEDISHSPYSHCAGIVKPNELIESQAFRREGYEALDTYDGVMDVFTCDTLTDVQRQGIVDYVLKRIGTSYNYELIGWEFVHYVFHRDLPFHEGDCYDCSELWRQAYKSVGLDPCPDVAYASPGDLAASKLFRRIK